MVRTYGSSFSRQVLRPWDGGHALFGILLFALGLLAGCATVPYRAHPQFDDRVRSIKTVALMPADVKVYELSAGGVPELIDEWSEQGKSNAATAVKSLLAGKGAFSLKDVSPSDDPKLNEAYDEVRALFEAVATSIILHTYHPALTIPERKDNFRYSLGPILDIASATDADALLFVYGQDHISTGGRKALMAVGLIVGLATRVYVGPRAGVSRLIVALVDARTGDILWVNVGQAGGSADLRDPTSTQSLATTIFESFAPTKTKP